MLKVRALQYKLHSSSTSAPGACRSSFKKSLQGLLMPSKKTTVFFASCVARCPWKRAAGKCTTRFLLPCRPREARADERLRVVEDDRPCGHPWLLDTPLAGNILLGTYLRTPVSLSGFRSSKHLPTGSRGSFPVRDQPRGRYRSCTAVPPAPLDTAVELTERCPTWFESISLAKPSTTLVLVPQNMRTI